MRCLTFRTCLLRGDRHGLQAAQVTFEAAQQLSGLDVPQPGHLIAGGSHLEGRSKFGTQSRASAHACMHASGESRLKTRSTDHVGVPWHPGDVEDRVLMSQPFCRHPHKHQSSVTDRFETEGSRGGWGGRNKHHPCTFEQGVLAALRVVEPDYTFLVGHREDVLLLSS